MSEQPSIEVKSWPRISYAMAHNGIPFIDEVLVRNPPTGQGVLQLSVTVTERGSNLTKPWSALIDSPGGPASGTVQPITFDSTALADIKLDPSVMADIEEQRPAEILVELTAGGVKVAETRREIRTLAPRQWLFIPGRTALSLSLLGAFIMPNDPVIGAVVAEARELLRERTGDSSTPGYQLGAERVDQMAEAIWDAMRARDISYSNPPASWDLEGQKVRTPHDVLEARVGTCLDTSVVLAAALEHVGINSVICVVEGHAFLAYWRVETSLGTSAMTDAAEFKNLCDLDALRVVETTAVTGGTSSQSIDGPARSSTVLTHLSGDLRGVHGVVDTQACRNADIVPLPASRRKRDGTVEVVEYRPETHSGQHFVAGSAGRRTGRRRRPRPRYPAAGAALEEQAARPQPAQQADQLHRGRHRCAGRAGRRAAARRGSAQRRQAHHAAARRWHDHIQQARGVQFGAHLPQDQLHEFLDKGQMFTPVSSDGYLTRLRSLAYKAKTIVEETGANNLYLALGSLNWSVAPKQGGPRRSVKSPLILVPVTLGRRPARRALPGWCSTNPVPARRTTA